MVCPFSDSTTVILDVVQHLVFRTNTYDFTTPLLYLCFDPS